MSIFSFLFYNASLILPMGPHLVPKFLTKPLRLYMPNLNRNLIGVDNRNRTVIYQWFNLINGKSYVGSAWKGSSRLLSYWQRTQPSVLNRNLPIYNSLNKYGHNNFALAILEDLGPTGSVTKEFMLKKEQYYLDILFSVDSDFILNNSPTAGSTLGFKHTIEFKLNRTGKLNPMYEKPFSFPPGFAAEFIRMQSRNKFGANNPQFGVKKSLETLAKLTKLVYVYDYITKNLIGKNIKRKFSNSAYRASDPNIGVYLEINNKFSGSVRGQLNPWAQCNRIYGRGRIVYCFYL